MHGKEFHSCRIEDISDQPFTESEFVILKREETRNSKTFPSLGYVDMARHNLHNLGFLTGVFNSSYYAKAYLRRAKW